MAINVLCVRVFFFQIMVRVVLKLSQNNYLNGYLNE